MTEFTPGPGTEAKPRARKRVAKSDRVQDTTPEPADPDAVETVTDAGVGPPEPEPATDDPELSALFAPAPIVHSKKVITQVQASTRPPKDKFFRVLEFDMETRKNCFPIYLFEYKFETDLSAKSFYVVPGTEAAQVLQDRERLQSALLVLGVTKLNSPFIWELKLPDGRNDNADQWAHSRIEKAHLATTTWLKLTAEPNAGGYNHEEPVAKYDDPDWSQFDFAKMVKAASKDRKISDLEHDAVKEALGL